MMDDPHEWRIYKRRERYRAHQLQSGLGWEVEGEDGKRLNYTDEDFKHLFQLSANTARAIDTEGTIHYS